MSEQRRKSRYMAESETELNAVAAENNNLQEDFYNEKAQIIVDKYFLTGKQTKGSLVPL